MGLHVTKEAQDLQDSDLASFRSMKVAVLPPVGEGHQPILYPNKGRLEGECCQGWAGDERLDVRAAKSEGSFYYMSVVWNH